MAEITFRVDGNPKPQPRARARGWVARDKATGKPVFTARTWNPETAEGWKALIVVAGQQHRPAVMIGSPVTLELRFYIERPRSRCRRKDPDGAMPHDGAGDVDNLAKAVLDVLTQMRFWRDDRQVWRLVVEKLYARKDGRPGMDLRLSWDEDEETAARQRQLAADRVAAF